MSEPRLRVLSLGAGLQNSAIIELAARGDIPPFDLAVFADTGWKPGAVYRQLDRLTDLAATAGMPVVRVSAGDIRPQPPQHRRRGRTRMRPVDVSGRLGGHPCRSTGGRAGGDGGR